MKYIIGAYATAPSLRTDDKEAELEFFKLLIESITDIRGLEIPFWGQNVHKFGNDFLFNILNPDWENVLTCVPGSVMSLPNNPKFGLASNDEEGRKLAVALHKRSNVFVHQINKFTKHKSIIAVHLASAPSIPKQGVFSSPEALYKSLQELTSWDWMGAKLNIEHCDETIIGKPFEKGFLSLIDEIEVIDSLSKEKKIGITLNWARSAIEGKNPNKVLDHIKMSKERNLLSGFIFSGTASNDEQYGSWKDNHMPFANSFGVKFYEENSLLTELNIRNTITELNVKSLDYIGIKLLSIPVENSDKERRVGLNKDALEVLNKIIKNN